MTTNQYRHCKCLLPLLVKGQMIDSFCTSSGPRLRFCRTRNPTAAGTHTEASSSFVKKSSRRSRPWAASARPSTNVHTLTVCSFFCAIALLKRGADTGSAVRAVRTYGLPAEKGLRVADRHGLVRSCHPHCWPQLWFLCAFGKGTVRRIGWIRHLRLAFMEDRLDRIASGYAKGENVW